MMNEETMHRNPLRIPIILQRITEYHTQIRTLSEQISAENQSRQSYLNRLSAEYGALPWWKKT